MFHLKRSNVRIEVKDTDQIPELINALLGDEQTVFSVEKSEQEYLSVVFTNRGCAVIHICYEPTYKALDASTEQEESHRRCKLMVDNELTSVPANMKLTKRQTIAIINEYCSSGKLSDIVYWVEERPPPMSSAGGGKEDTSG